MFTFAHVHCVYIFLLQAAKFAYCSPSPTVWMRTSTTSLTSGLSRCIHTENTVRTCRVAFIYKYYANLPRCFHTENTQQICRVAFIKKTFCNFAAWHSKEKHFELPRVAFIQKTRKFAAFHSCGKHFAIAITCLGPRSSSSMVVVTPSAILWDLTCSSGRSSSFQEQPLYSLSLYLLYLSGGEFSKFSSFVIAMFNAVVGLKNDII